jgi:hypothetical protein
LELLRTAHVEEQIALTRKDWYPLLREAQKGTPALQRWAADILACVPSAITDQRGYAFLRRFSTGHILYFLCIHIQDSRWPELWRELNERDPVRAEVLRKQAVEVQSDRARTLAGLIAEADKSRPQAVGHPSLSSEVFRW